MNRFVIDANVAAKWYLQEVDSDVATRLLMQDAEFHAPHFLELEFASIFWKQTLAGYTTIDVWRLSIAHLKKTIPNWYVDKDIVENALELAVANSHPIYDCLYLALAVRIDGVVVTADKQFLSHFSKSIYRRNMLSLSDASN